MSAMRTTCRSIRRWRRSDSSFRRRSRRIRRRRAPALRRAVGGPCRRPPVVPADRRAPTAPDAPPHVSVGAPARPRSVGLLPRRFPPAIWSAAAGTDLCLMLCRSTLIWSRTHAMLIPLIAWRHRPARRRDPHLVADERCTRGARRHQFVLLFAYATAPLGIRRDAASDGARPRRAGARRERWTATRTVGVAFFLLSEALGDLDYYRIGERLRDRDHGSAVAEARRRIARDTARHHGAHHLCAISVRPRAGRALHALAHGRRRRTSRSSKRDVARAGQSCARSLGAARRPSGRLRSAARPRRCRTARRARREAGLAWNSRARAMSGRCPTDRGPPYPVAQESLTNAVRHAASCGGPRPARLRRRGCACRRRRRRRRPLSRRRLGIEGMRERAALSAAPSTPGPCRARLARPRARCRVRHDDPGRRSPTTRRSSAPGLRMILEAEPTSRSWARLPTAREASRWPRRCARRGA